VNSDKIPEMPFKKSKVLFVHQALLPFVEKDSEILKSAHEVKEFCFRGISDIISLFKWILWCEVSFSWFGSIHAFFSVLFSEVLAKKSIVVAGGHDVACEPEIEYGMFLHWWKRWCPRYVFNHASLVLSVSKNTTRECLENAKTPEKKVKLLYHGFDSERFKPTDNVKKEQVAVTIGRVCADNLRKKGLELFVRSAQVVPEAKFFLIGPWDDCTIDYLKAIASPNVTFTGGLYGEDLVHLCSRAKVYVQVSYHESFGCSIAEAMLCECIPVISKRAAIPEVVGDCGFYVEELSAEHVGHKIHEALYAPDILGKMARERIINLFPLKKRKDGLLKSVDSLTDMH
jgi:glycosyltransferase involved in cell wall biosynthesis